ncbi:FecCD family ABC transporter permease [Catellatospora citrea]|uniref:Iron ABC transporter permease n=1 Tax=Catellatospora citrea TaxID=53366 RepID=A0A8J3KB34_9ACTN|nr:iron chelate uptake ABC transporter family permease subunit [Catellatospora citrea]RKE12446.1 iron complex transport system permease protein [Catellatospora citrea]GIF96322.1 iron ABC transporter permease [Catellatospora citrea]
MTQTTGVLTAPHTAEPVRAPRAGHAWRRGGLVLGVLTLACVLALSIAVGSRTIPLDTVWHVLWHDDGSAQADIVHQLRIPRTLLGLGVGAALGLAGALMQALTRNPLAEPGLLGVNLGASSGVVVAIAFLGLTSPSAYVWFAFGGAALTATAVFALGGSGRFPTPERQVLAGVSITAVLGALVWAVLVTNRGTFDRYRHWDVGSLADRDSDTLLRVAPFLIAGILLTLTLGGRLNALSMGDEAATALGAHPGRIRVLGVAAITLLCGAATAACGPIWFLGLAVPYIARLVTGPDHRWILAYAVVLGPVLLLGADVLGRVLTAPSELQVGIVTAFLGAPVFIALCRRRKLGAL